MKKCPVCNAEIDDTANFCLYCMTSFDQKKNIVPIKRIKKRAVIATSSITALIICTVLVITAIADNEPYISGFDIMYSPPAFTSISTVNTETANASSPSLPATRFVTQESSPTAIYTPAPTLTAAPEATPTVSPSYAVTPTITVTPKVTPTVSPSYAVKVTPTPAPINGVIYKYMYTKNDVIITDLKVVQPPSDGVYEIPPYIDGKKVVGVFAYALLPARPIVTAVIFPETIESIGKNLLLSYQYTDLHFYIKSNNVDWEDIDYLSEQYTDITVHCSEQCRNADGRTLKDIFAETGIKYEEWNG